MKAAHARGLAEAFQGSLPHVSTMLCRKPCAANYIDRASEIYHLLHYILTLECETNVDTLIHKYDELQYSHEQNMPLMLPSPRSQAPPSSNTSPSPLFTLRAHEK